MKTVGIFFGTTGGKTQEVVDILAAQLGDAAIFGGNYVESMKHFYDAVEPKGAKIVGFTSTDGYDFEASEAVIDGDKFMGLAIDASFDTDEITSKVEDWLENKVKDELL